MLQSELVTDMPRVLLSSATLYSEHTATVVLTGSNTMTRYTNPELLSRIRNYNLEKKKYLVNSEDTGPLPLENFHRSQVNFMAATTAHQSHKKYQSHGNCVHIFFAQYLWE